MATGSIGTGGEPSPIIATLGHNAVTNVTRSRLLQRDTAMQKTIITDLVVLRIARIFLQPDISSRGGGRRAPFLRGIVYAPNLMRRRWDSV
jgi:hypothetical protein